MLKKALITLSRSCASRENKGKNQHDGGVVWLRLWLLYIGAQRRLTWQILLNRTVSFFDSLQCFDTPCLSWKYPFIINRIKIKNSSELIETINHDETLKYDRRKEKRTYVEVLDSYWESRLRRNIITVAAVLWDIWN